MAIEYEVTYLLRPHLEEADVDARSAAVADALKGAGGEVVSIEKLGKKRLAYEVQDVREGIYVVMRFRSEPEAAKELERQLGLNEDVMRSILVKVDKNALAVEKAPQPPAPAPAPAP